jgi:hypothetical protein
MAIEVPTSEIIQRVFAISPDGKSCGSALAYPVNGTFHFITAAHVLEGMPQGKNNNLYMFKENQWRQLDVIPYYVEQRPYREGDIDLAIVKTQIPVSEKEPTINLSPANMIIGQDVYFLGFPYFGGGINHRPEAFNEGFPLPFIKKATLSAMHHPVIYLDGHNNPGFSGGPVMFWDHQEKKRKILGVISAYLTQSGEIKKIETSAKEFYRENSGIGIAYNINLITDLIEVLSKKN